MLNGNLEFVAVCTVQEHHREHGEQEKYENV